MGGTSAARFIMEIPSWMKMFWNPRSFCFWSVWRFDRFGWREFEIMYLELDVMSVKKETGDSSFLGAPVVLAGGGSL